MLNSLFNKILWTTMLMGDWIEIENKNKLRTEYDILYCTINKVLPLRLELTFKRPFFIICQSPLPTALCICLSILIVRFH